MRLMLCVLPTRRPHSLPVSRLRSLLAAAAAARVVVHVRVALLVAAPVPVPVDAAVARPVHAAHANSHSLTLLRVLRHLREPSHVRVRRTSLAVLHVRSPCP